MKIVNLTFSVTMVDKSLSFIQNVGMASLIRHWPKTAPTVPANRSAWECFIGMPEDVIRWLEAFSWSSVRELARGVKAIGGGEDAVRRVMTIVPEPPDAFRAWEAKLLLKRAGILPRPAEGWTQEDYDRWYSEEYLRDHLPAQR